MTERFEIIGRIAVAAARRIGVRYPEFIFGRDHSTVSYHAALWRLKRNAADWNATVAALRPDWSDAPGPR